MIRPANNRKQTTPACPQDLPGATASAVGGTLRDLVRLLARQAARDWLVQEQAAGKATTGPESDQPPPDFQQ